MSYEIKKNVHSHCGGCTGCVNLPEKIQLRQWCDCDVCVHGDYTPSQGAYWCKEYGGYDPRGGCTKGIPR